MFTTSERSILNAIFGNQYTITDAFDEARAYETLSAFAKIPSDFTRVNERLPETDIPVLVIRRSGYTYAAFEVLTAKYMPSYRPRNPWQTLGHDAITDSGEPVLAWRYAHDLFNPA